MIETSKWLLAIVFGVWALILCACLIYLGRVYLETKRIGIAEAQQANLRKSVEE